MKKIMLINVLQPEECRIAILEDGVLEELYVERTSHESYVGNIYKGRIVNIEPSIQAAFVDFGVGRNGFLHVSDVEPTYYRHLEGGGRGGRGGGPQRDRDRDRDRGRREGRYRFGEFDDEPAPVIHGPGLDPDEYEGVAEGPEPGSVDVGLGFEEPPEVVESAEPVDVLPDPVIESVVETGPDTSDDAAVELTSAVEPAPIEIEVAAPPADEGVADTAVAEVQTGEAEEAPAVEEEAPAVEEPARETRRKTTRRKKDDAAPKKAAPRRRKTKAEAETPEPPAEAEPSEADLQPRPMDSAERRTDEGEGPSGRPMDDEDLLFFPPRTRPTTPPKPRAPEPEPAPAAREERAAPAAREERAAPVEPPAPAERPPRREAPREGRREGGRREGGRRGEGRRGERRFGSIEDTLEADLREAQVEATDDDTGPPAPRQERLEPAEPDTEVEREPLPESGAEPEGDEWDDDPRFRDLDDFPPPRPQQERGERGGRGRGERGGRGGRGERGGRPGRPAGRDGRGARPKPLIQDIFRRGQEVIVQVIKEGLGTKGPTLSTYISIAGRYLVLMPGLNRVGVSKKIIDEEQRRRLRQIFDELKPPRGLGFIIRTAGEDKDKKELQRDLAYLSRLWQVVARRIKRNKTPCEIYQESDMITRTIRDTFTSDIDAIVIDEPAAFERAQEFMQVVMPKYADRIQLYAGSEPLFHKYGIENEIDRIQQKKVPLPNGGSIVIEQTEALVAIDVNSGNFRADNNAEETAYQMNLLAAKEIGRQLRLRDLGGVIVNDFIDMRDEKHRRNVERALREALKRDRARTKCLRMSAFGIIEMTRQRIRPSLKRSVYQECQGCKGHGLVKTAESMSIEVTRLLQLAAHREYIRLVKVRVADEVANYLHNRKRREIGQLEESGRLQVTVSGIIGAPPEMLEFNCYDNNNNEVKLFAIDDRRPARR